MEGQLKELRNTFEVLNEDRTEYTTHFTFTQDKRPLVFEDEFLHKPCLFMWLFVSDFDSDKLVNVSDMDDEQVNKLLVSINKPQISFYLINVRDYPIILNLKKPNCYLPLNRSNVLNGWFPPDELFYPCEGFIGPVALDQETLDPFVLELRNISGSWYIGDTDYIISHDLTMETRGIIKPEPLMRVEYDSTPDFHNISEQFYKSPSDVYPSRIVDVMSDKYIMYDTSNHLDIIFTLSKKFNDKPLRNRLSLLLRWQK